MTSIVVIAGGRFGLMASEPESGDVVMCMLAEGIMGGVRAHSPSTDAAGTAIHANQKKNVSSL